MKKVINGKMYNTETAKKLDSNGTEQLSYSDFNYWCETLYLKKNR